MTVRRGAGDRGLGTTGLVVTVGVLALLGIGGWTGWCYYQVLEKESAMAKALDGLGVFRDHQPTKARIQQQALTQIRAKGGRLELGDVRVLLEPLTPKNAARLPKFSQRKLRLRCRLQQDANGYDSRLERIRDAAQGANTLGRGFRRPPRPMAAPAAPTGRGCTPELLESLGWSFVHVEATSLIKVGWIKRRVKVKTVFFLMDPVKSAEPKPDAAEDDADDE